MRQKFLALVEEVKNTGIVQACEEASTAEELAEVWRNFSGENQDLCTRIREWATEFQEAGSRAILWEGENFENPLEIVEVISIIGDENVTECEIFSNWVRFCRAVEEVGTDYAVAVAYCIAENYICNITAEDIFSEKEALANPDSEEDEED